VSLTTLIIVGIIIYILYFIFKPKSEDDYSKPKAKSTPQKLSREKLNNAINKVEHEFTSRKKEMNIITNINVPVDEAIKDSKKDSYGKSQSIKYKSKIPKGYKIYLDIRDIVLGYNINTARKFINAKNQTLTLARESGNEYDKNAIAVLSYEGKLGYIHSHIASSLVKDTGKDLMIRHQYIWVGEKRGTLHIQLLIKK